MSDKTGITILKAFAILILMLALWYAGYIVGNIAPQELGVGSLMGSDKQHPTPLPTIKEIQEKIGAKPDGILGPETQRLWDKAICDQYGIYECEMAGI